MKSYEKHFLCTILLEVTSMFWKVCIHSLSERETNGSKVAMQLLLYSLKSRYLKGFYWHNYLGKGEEMGNFCPIANSQVVSPVNSLVSNGWKFRSHCGCLEVKLAGVHFRFPLVHSIHFGWGQSIYYVHPQGGWVDCRWVYSDVLWWVGGFSLDVRTHHVQRILKIYSSFSGASLVYSWLSII